MSHEGSSTEAIKLIPTLKSLYQFFSKRVLNHWRCSESTRSRSASKCATLPGLIGWHFKCLFRKLQPYSNDSNYLTNAPQDCVIRRDNCRVNFLYCQFFKSVSGPGAKLANIFLIFSDLIVICEKPMLDKINKRFIDWFLCDCR